MHNNFLGNFQRVVGKIFWATFDAGVWGEEGGDQEQRMQLFTLRLRNELHVWYEAEQVDHSYRIHDITPAMLGVRGAPNFKAKAAETGPALRFAVCVSQRVGPHAGERAALLALGHAFVNYVKVLRGPLSRVVSAGAQQDLGRFSTWDIRGVCM